MATLTGKKIKDSYVELLKLDSSTPNEGATATLKAVETGKGTDTALSLSTVQIASNVDGSAGTPAFTRSSDPNTGIFFPAADTIAFAEGATEVMRINSSGNVGIGTSSPSRQLDVNKTAIFDTNGGGTTTSPSVAIGSPAVGLSYIGSQNLVAITNSTERLRINSSGNVGIGTTNPSNYKLEVNGTLAAGLSLAGGRSGSEYDRIGYNFRTTSTNNLYNYNITDASSNLEFWNGGFRFWTSPSGTAGDAITYTERLRIDSSGQVGIGLIPTARNNTRLQIVDGIGFPSTQVASSDANTLDDYEEGTWPPTIIGTSTAGTANYTTATARYTKIGRQVFFEANITWGSGSGTGDLRISGLPFTSSNTTTLPSVAIGYWNDVVKTANHIPTAHVDNNATQIVFRTIEPDGGTAGTVAYDAAGAIQVSGSYTV